MARRQYKGGQPPTKEAPQDAWVVLLMIGTSYLPGALVAGQSLRQMKTRHQLVCMVTPDIGEETKVQLMHVYDEVVTVPYIEHATRPFKSAAQNEMYQGWIDRSFTKWNCLNLTKFRRVMLVDADIVFLVNVDELFDLRPPAACFSLPWLQPWQPKGLENPYVGAAGLPVVHGETVPAATVKRALLMKTCVGGGFLQLHAPSAEAYRGVLELLAAAPVYGANHLTTSGADEQVIADLVSADWVHIDPRYAAMPGKERWVSTDIKAYHYFHAKPWELSAEEWPDLASWWRVADQLAAAEPALAAVFRPAAASALDAALADFRLMADIRQMGVAALKGAPAKGVAALKGAPADAALLVDKALVSWVSENSFRPRAPGEWSALFTADPSNDFLLEAGVSALGLASLASAIKEKVRARLGRRPVASGHRADCGGGVIRYGGHGHFEMTARDRAVAARSCASAAHLRMFYGAAPLLGRPLIPRAAAAALAQQFEITGEALASPLQAHFYGDPGWVFAGSYDFEEAAGSCGSFFKLGPAELKRGWFVYLPAGPTAAAAAAARALAMVEQVSFVACPTGALTAASLLRAHPSSVESWAGPECVLFAIHVPEKIRPEVLAALIAAH